MKKLFFILFAIAILGEASAQEALIASTPITAVPAASTPPTTILTNVTKTVFITPENQWSYINMETKQDLVWFSHLDGLSEVTLHLTDANGREYMKMSVNSRHNMVNCSKFSAGLYYLTLINERTDERKAFTLKRP